MIEIIALAIVLGGFHETAKRRGATGWPFIVVGLLGWLFFSTLGVGMVGAGPHLLLAWGWVGLTFLSIFVLAGGGRRMKETWQCPECRCFNPPTTLVCLCGYDPEQASEASS